MDQRRDRSERKLPLITPPEINQDPDPRPENGQESFLAQRAAHGRADLIHLCDLKSPFAHRCFRGDPDFRGIPLGHFDDVLMGIHIAEPLERESLEPLLFEL